MGAESGDYIRVCVLPETTRDDSKSVKGVERTSRGFVSLMLPDPTKLCIIEGSGGVFEFAYK